MEKHFIFYYGDNNSEIISLVHPAVLEKTAGMSDELVTYINNLKPKPGKTYALVNALSAGEYYSSNRNGDYFSEKTLKQYHKTFEALGHVYKHHVNKDPNKSLGKVIFSHYNEYMHRVELIVELDNTKAADIIADLKAGKLAAVSMGARVSADECSICGSKHKTRAEYCEHLAKQMNKILPDGRKVYAINHEPKFFDLSIVRIGAEKTAGFLQLLGNNEKIENKSIEKLAFLNDALYIKEAELKTTAEMKKTITNVTSALVKDDPKDLITAAKTAKNIKKDVLYKLSEFPLNETLSTFIGLQIFPKYEDFAELVSMNKTAELGHISLDNFNEEIAQVLLPIVPELSLTKDLIIARGVEKIAELFPTVNQQIDNELQMQSTVPPNNNMLETQNPILPLGVLGALYYGYAKVFRHTDPSKFREFMLKYPWLLPVVIGGASFGSAWAQNAEFSKTAGLIDKFMVGSLISFPTSYYLSGKYQNEQLMGKRLNPLQEFVKNHPALTALTTAGVGAKIGQKLTKTAQLIQRLPNETKESLVGDILKIYELNDLEDITNGRN
jgi:hypothetical protein